MFLFFNFFRGEGGAWRGILHREGQVLLNLYTFIRRKGNSKASFLQATKESMQKQEPLS